MSSYKHLTSEDVQRIKRGIIYSIPERLEEGAIRLIGEYGDMCNQTRNNGKPAGQFIEQSMERLELWLLNRIDGILSGDEFSGSTEWKIVEGRPVAPASITVVPGKSEYLVS